MSRLNRHYHLEIKTPNGRWVPYCVGIAYADFPKGLPSINEVLCMQFDSGRTLEEMRDIAVKKYELEVRVAEGVCPTFKGQ